MKYQNIGFCQP